MTYTIHGVQRQESCKTHSKREAVRTLRARLGDIAQGRYFPPVATKSPFLSAWAEEFLETVRDESTKERYGYSVQHLVSFFKKARLAEITPRDIEMFKKKRLASGVGPATCNRDLSVLRRMMKLALRQRLISETPFTGVEFLEERKYRRQPHILTFEEQTRLIAIANPHLRALIILITETGLRVNKEALQLKWSDFDFQNSQVTVRESKTLAGRRIVPLSELCKQELLRWRALTGPEYSEFVFPNSDTPSNPLGSIRKTWSTALKRAKLSHFPVYDLRHCFASRLAAAGASPIIVAQMLGHSSTGIVMTYAKAIDEARRDAIQKLEVFRESHNIDSSEGRHPEVIH